MRISTLATIQKTQLLQCPVWDVTTGKILGLVQHIWIDKQLHQVMGLTYWELDHEHEINSLTWEQVEAVNTEGVWVNYAHSTSLIVRSTTSIHYQLDEPLWTTSHHRLGTLQDVTFEVNSGDVLDYHCVSDRMGLEAEQFRFSPRVMHHSCDRWIVDMDIMLLHTRYPSRALAAPRACV
ncbi:hypothetical protein ACSYAD_11450 [Acaryochloris marina NIES-2412]|uniref:hypothetical protein n=1 Tax=Acaryochloris marina TaxID=155978 RepID=UPI004059A4AF